ncbi:hypothetical protein V7S43_010142 [Phytophthora oleae]|uniref:Uncharacterized protein n=1 Tax=Phytophthora oleae TaxID=2107226 RepID=A0ABD3FDH9_9STRA
MPTAILNRIHGPDLTYPISSLEAILRGFVEESDFPSPDTSVTWVNPKTGSQVAFSLRHAVEYTRFIDGGLSPVPATVGTAFYLPPPLPAAPAIRTRTGTLREATSQMFELEDDDDAILDEVEDQRPPAAPVATTSDNQLPASKRARRIAPQQRDEDESMLQRLAARPDLQHLIAQRYLNSAAQAASTEVQVGRHTFQPRMRSRTAEL